MKNTDLHTHSYYSDGQYSPKELVRLAKKRGIKNLALTDHDSIKCVREAIKEGKKIGVNIIPAVEIRYKKSEILGYFIDIKNKKLISELKKSSKQNENAVKEWCNKIEKAGYNISFKEIWKKYPKARGNINELHVLYELHLKGYGTTRDVAKRLSEQKIKKRKSERFSILKAIKLVKEANGIPVLAHPWFDSKTLKEKNIKKYIKAGLKGIEIKNGDTPSFMKKVSKRKNIIKIIKKLAKKYNLILTSGSDYHGERMVELMPGNHALGKNNCDEKIIQKLIS